MSAPSTTTPVLEGFDPISPEFLAHPEPILDQALRETPVFFVPAFGYWVVTRYEDVLRILGDSATFSQNAAALIPPPPELADRISASTLTTKSFMNADPPYHTLIRKAVNTAFKRHEVYRMAPVIEQIATELIDRFIDDGHCELLHDFCYELSQRTVLKLLGLPDSEDVLPRYRQWGDDTVSVFTARPAPGEEIPQTISDEELHIRWTRIAEGYEFLAGICAERRAEPRDDLISSLAQLREDNGELTLTDEQVLSLTATLIIAGTHATAISMAQAVLHFDEHPEQLAEARRDQKALQNAYEESLRLRGPGIGLFRWTNSDVEIAGVAIPKNSRVMIMFCSTGLDERQFTCPHEFHIDRENADTHLSFGRGRHFCLGAPLARAEAEIGLRSLYERIPDLRVVPDQTLEYEPSVIAFLLKRLEVDWTPQVRHAA